MTTRLRRGEILLQIGAFLLGLLASAVVAGVWFMTMTGSGDTPVLVESLRLRERNGDRGEIGSALRKIEDRLAGARVPSTPIRGNLSIQLGDIIWSDGARRPFARAASMSGLLSATAAERGDVLIDGAVLTGAHVLLDQPLPRGDWNYQRVMAELLDDERSEGPRRTIRLTNTTVRDARVEIHQPARDIVLEDVTGDLARIELSSPVLSEPQIDVRTVSATYADLRKEQRLAVRGEDGRVRLPKGRVDFEVDRALLGSTRLADLEGTWAPGTGGLGLTIAGRANDVALEELAWMSDRLPRTGRGSFSFAVRPLAGERMEVRLTDADLRLEGSHVRGAVALHVGGEPVELVSVDARLDPLAMSLLEQLMGRELPYSGTLTGTVRGTGERLAFDVTTDLAADTTGERINTRIEGQARLTGGFALQTLTADLRAVPASALKALMPSLPFKGAISGTITLSGPPTRAPLNLNVRLDVGGGVALVNGLLDLTGTQPTYDLSGRLIGLNLNQMLQPQAPPASLTARFTLRGRGIAPESADARVALAGRFTGWHAQPHDTVMLAAHVRNGTLAIDTGAVYLGPVHVETQGEWRFVAPASGALNYSFAVENLEQIAPYIPALPDSAGGVLEGSGAIAGSLDRMRIEGSLEGEELNLLRWRAESLQLKHRLVLGGTVPEIELEAGIRGISTPSTGAYSAASVNLRLTPPAFVLEVRADRVGGGIIEVAADGQIPYEGARRVVVQRVRMDLGTGQWALAAPASINWGTGSGVNVTNLELLADEGEGRLRVEGRVLPLADAELRLETAALPLDEVQRMVGVQPKVTGLLWATADVRAAGETSATFEIGFRIDSGQFEGVPFSRVQGELGYTGQTLTANALMTFDTVGTLDVRASLPMRVVFAPEIDVRLLDAGAVNASLVADSVKLAAFTGFFPDLRDVQGILRANAQLTGTVANPQLGGTIAVTGGAGTFRPLNRAYTDVNADIVFNQRSAEVRSIRARSDGTAEVTGRIDFPSISDPEAELTIRLDGFRAAGVENHEDAAASGQLHIRGPLLGPTISGAVTLDDGDVPVPVVGSNPLDAELAELGDPMDLSEVGPTTAEPTFMDRVRVDDLRLIAGPSLWFSMHNARAQLAGELTINKDAGDLRITGTLEGERGTYTLEAGPVLRRFDITQAQVRFLGASEINPALNITARRVIVQGDEELDIQVRIGGTLKTPTLSLASSGAANIPQSELLSYLLFGQGTLGLSTPGTMVPGQAILEQAFLGGLTERGSLWLEELGVPLDIQIRPGGAGIEQGLNTATVVLGKEVSNNVFLTLEQAVEVLFGDQTGSPTSQSPYTAIRLEWRMDPRTSLRAGYETANRRQIRGLGVALPATRQQPQATIEVRRRWRW